MPASTITDYIFGNTIVPLRYDVFLLFVLAQAIDPIRSIYCHDFRENSFEG